MRDLKDAALVSAVDQFTASSAWAGQQFDRHGYKLSSLRVGDTLRRDEWRFIEDTLVEEGAIRIGLVDRLMGAGLRLEVPGAFGKTEILYELATDMEPAEVAIEALATNTRNDRVTFDNRTIPNPIVFKSWFLSRRVIEASRNRGEPLPTTQMRYAMRKVQEKIDDLALNGGGPVLHGNVGYGVNNHPDINHVGFSAGLWSDDTCDGADMVKDINNGMEASKDARHYGPWGLVIPSTFDTRMGEDYSAIKGANTIRQRLMDIEGLSWIMVHDQQPQTAMTMIELQRDTVEVADGEAPQPIQWDTGDGMGTHFKIVAIRNLIVKSDIENRSGIVHFTLSGDS